MTPCDPFQLNELNGVSYGDWGYSRVDSTYRLDIDMKKYNYSEFSKSYSYYWKLFKDSLRLRLVTFSILHDALWTHSYQYGVLHDFRMFCVHCNCGRTHLTPGCYSRFKLIFCRPYLALQFDTLEPPLPLLISILYFRKSCKKNWP